jgi:hypothetical protein
LPESHSSTSLASLRAPEQLAAELVVGNLRHPHGHASLAQARHPLLGLGRVGTAPWVGDEAQGSIVEHHDPTRVQRASGTPGGCGRGSP